MMISNDMYLSDPALNTNDRADSGCLADDLEQGDQEVNASPLHCQAPLAPFPGTGHTVVF